MPTYRYCGDEPTVFISLSKDGETWVPKRGDEIELEEAVSHPLLELVVAEKRIAKSTIKTDEAKPEIEETPTVAEPDEEN